MEMQVPAEFAQLLAGPTTSRPKCPECGGSLSVHVTLYTRGPVELERFPLTGGASLRHAEGINETRKALVEQATENYTGARVDEREEVECDSCDWWCHPVDLELG